MDRHPEAGRRDRPLPLGSPRLHVLFHGARAGGLCHLTGLHAGLRLLGRPRPASGEVAGPVVGHPAEHPCSRLHAGARPRHGGGLPADERRPRASRYHHDLHRPGVEHDVQLVPLAQVGASRHQRSFCGLPLRLVGALQVGGAAVRDDRARVEQHDEHGGRLVLPDDQRGFPSRRPRLPAARPRLLHERGGARRQAAGDDPGGSR